MAESDFFSIEQQGRITVLRLTSGDSTNRLTRACVLALKSAIDQIAQERLPLVITGNQKFFSAGADLAEIAALTGPDAYQFSLLGQALMTAIENFPAPVYAAVNGYCMGGGFDLALACHRRFASRDAVFGHRGAALGLITGWGGTQRLPRLIGKGKALELLVAAEKQHAPEALRIGLVDTLADDPVAAAVKQASETISRVVRAELG